MYSLLNNHFRLIIFKRYQMTTVEDPFSGTVLEHLRNNTLQDFVAGSNPNTSQWYMFGNPNAVMTPVGDTEKRFGEKFPCQFEATNWLATYSTEAALNNLMEFYANYKPKFPTMVDKSYVYQPFGVKCEIAKALNMDFSKTPTEVVERLVVIVVDFIAALGDRSRSPIEVISFHQNSTIAIVQIMWLIQEVIPLLMLWIIDLHLKRAEQPIYNDSTLNYITQVFLLLQGSEFVVTTQKVMDMRSRIISAKRDKDSGLFEFSDNINEALNADWTLINNKISAIIDVVMIDPNLSEAERHVTLAGIYDLRYRYDEKLAKDKVGVFHSSVSDYKIWLDKVTSHCKLASNFKPKITKGTGADDVNDRVCTFFGRWTRKPVDPVFIKGLGKPVLPVPLIA
jgi:hypothetical protein